MYPSFNKMAYAHYVWLLLSTLPMGCEKSPLGPEISGQPLPSSNEPISVVNPLETHNIESSTVSTPSSVSVVCTAEPQRQVFYTGSTIKLNFTCNKSVLSVTPSSLPSFLSLTADNQRINATGVAPSSPASYSWSFAPISQGDTSVTTSHLTQILNSQTLTSTLSPPSAFDGTNNLTTSNGVDFDLGHSVTLDSSWDGAMSDVALKASSISTDLTGVSLFSNCSMAAEPYICNGTATHSGLIKNNGLNLKWRWGAFDQGLYTLRVFPEVTIEGGTTSLSPVQTTFEVPIQTSGNISLSHQADVKHNNLIDYRYKLSIVASDSSTPSIPLLGLVYPSYLATTRAFFTRFTIDRSLPPASSGLSLSQSGTQIDLTNGDIARNFSVKTLSQGDWISVGLKATSGGADDVTFYRLSDIGGVPAITTSVGLTQYSSTGYFAVDVDMTEPFTEGTSTKVMVPFVRNIGGQFYLSLAKANVAGTTRTTILDDTDYGVDTSAGYNVLDMDSSASSLSRLKVGHMVESGTSYVYVAYRMGANLRIGKARTQFNQGYGLVGPVTVATGVFSSGSRETLDLALGSYGGETTAGIVYATSGDRCFFRRSNANLSTLSSTTTIGSGTSGCYGPRIHYDTLSGRFIVIYGEINGSNKYDIKYVEVIPGTTDTLSSPTTVVQDLSAMPLRMGSAFYQAGHWIALVYRVGTVNQLRFHGFHVSGF